jgi:glutathione S-transferase
MPGTWEIAGGSGRWAKATGRGDWEFLKEQPALSTPAGAWPSQRFKLAETATRRVRYAKEAQRLYGVLDRHLAERDYVAPEYSIADMAISHGRRATTGTRSI